MKNALEWLKNNWILVVAGVAIVFLLWQRSVSEDLLSKVLKSQQEQTEAHLQEIRDLEAVNKAKDAEIHKLVLTYEEERLALQKDYAALLGKINSKSTKKRSRIVKDAYRDPTTLSDKIFDTFYIPYYEEGAL